MATQDTEQFNLWDLLALLRRQLRLIILTVLLTVGISLVLILLATPRYTATALLSFDPARKNVLESTAADNLNSSTANSLIEGEVEILRSDAVALATIERTNLVTDDEFGPQQGLNDRIMIALGLDTGPQPSGQELLGNTLRRFKDSMDVNRRGLTYVMSVSVTSVSAQRAADLANALSETYIDLQVQSKVSEALRTRDILDNQLDAAQQALARAEAAFAAYIEDNIERLEAESGSEALAALRAELERLDAEFQDTRFRISRANSALQSANWDDLVSTLQTDALASLQQREAQLRAELNRTAADSDLAIDLRQELDGLQRQLSSVGQTEIARLQDSEAEFTTLQRQTRDDIRRELLTAEISPEALSDIYALRREASIAQQQYDTILSRVRLLETEALVQVADSRIVSAAMVPLSPSYPNRKLLLAFAIVAAGGIAAGLAFLNDFLTGGLNSASQVIRTIPARIGASIPQMRLPADRLSLAGFVTEYPMSNYAEAFRRLRSVIDRVAPDNETSSQLIAVISANSGEGRTTNAIALARTFAVSGKLTLLVDADMRNPSIHKHIGVETQSSLLDYLLRPEDHSDGSDFFNKDPATGMGVILGRRRSDVPTDLPIQSRSFQDLIDSARRSFDVIVLDLPPILSVVDARYVLPQADTVLFCVKAGETRQADLRRAYVDVAEYIKKDTPILCVLTGVESDDATSFAFFGGSEQ